MTTRYSRGHAGVGVTSRYSRGHYVSSTPSRWYYRSQATGRYRHYYSYYGRDSNHYFAYGRWLPLPPGHIHGPGCGHGFHYGRWIVSTVPYPVFVPVPVDAGFYYDGGWHEEAPIYVEDMMSAPVMGEIVEEPEPVPAAPPILTKAERELVLITRRYDLDWWQARRVEDLISKGIIESVLAGGEGGESNRFVYDKQKEKMTITASPDDILRMRTIIDDDRTYKFFTQEDLGGLVADAIPLVDLQLLEQEPTVALRVAADNYSGADEILRSSETSPAGREWWFNDRLGTMTVKSVPENLDEVYDSLESRPYFRPEFDANAQAM